MPSKKKYFDEVDLKCDFSLEENKLLKHWYGQNIVKKYLNKNNSSKKYFSFLDGPITANNPMGVHHAWGRTYKDLWQRYKNMNGYKQRFQNGFDCQGLWVEVEVEKELGFSNKKDIDKYGIAEFIQKCKDRVIKYSTLQKEQTIRLGNFMDWDNSYYTMSDENNYMIWLFLKKCHDKKLIYKGSDVVPWCYRCETAISEHEILTEDYKEIEHISVYFRLPIIGRENEYLLVWTTTPWTIPANIAVAIDSEGDYALVEFEGMKYWIMDSLKNALFDNSSKIIKIIKGVELVGLKYRSPFDDLPVNKALLENKMFHTVVSTDKMIMPISDQEGTGLVHTSTGTGSEDHRLGKSLGLPVIPAIEDNANYLEGFGTLSGLNAKKRPEIIFDILKSKDNGKYLFKLHPYKHRYPACWRCKSELVWKLADEWYIKIDPVRDDMIKITKKIKWLPSFGLKRELDWLSNMHDWLISKKNRYWGLALPIWECECGNFEVIGGKDELKERSTEGWNKFEGHTPHKPFIDFVKIKCNKCGKNMTRIPDVGNPWLDAGIVPFSTISKDNKSEPLYTEDIQEFKKWFPADFITESFPGQFKNWFYSVLAMSTILENEIPYKHVLGYATLFAEDGRPMHKSWGNSIEFNEGAEKIGADVMRWMYASARPADNLLFGYKTADDVRRRFYLKLWNIYNFFITYANIDFYSPPNKSTLNSEKLGILDRWLIIRLQETLTDVNKYLEKYDSYNATVQIESFVDDFSNWYIRRSRSRSSLSATDLKDKTDFYNTTYFTLIALVKIIAPFVPFLSDRIFKNLTKKDSVHLEDWPEMGIPTDEKIICDMKTIRDVSEVIHAERKEKMIALKQPLSSAKVICNADKPSEDFIRILLDETNLMGVNWQKKAGELLINVELDLNITEELQEKAKCRELIRKIQNERKNIGVELTDRVNVVSDWLPSGEGLLQEVKNKTLSNTISMGKTFTVKKCK